MSVFWFSFLGSIYSYLLYPLFLMAWPARRPVDASPVEQELPKISVIIAARNEESRITDKLEDILAHDYPTDKLEVLVVSDASNDGTDELVLQFAAKGVTLLRKDQREGKESAQILGIRHAAGDALVFTDVATRFGPGSLKAAARSLSAPGVGAVSSVDSFEGSSGSGEGLYVRYEMGLRGLESHHAGLVGLSGSFFAVRREVAEQWRTDVPSDFSAALNSVRLTLRAVHNPGMVGIYPDLKREADEFARKRRTAVRGMAALGARSEVLNPLRYGFFAFQVWSHKVMRWLVPWFLAALMVASLAIASSYWPAQVLLWGQLVCYGLALLGWLWPAARNYSAVRVPFYFVQVNLALAAALIDVLRGRRVVVWEPSRR